MGNGWAGIASNHRTLRVILRQAVNAQQYRDKNLAPVVLPFIQHHMPNGNLQHDNTHGHTATLTTEVLQANNAGVMDWPFLSLDLNH